MLTRRVSAGIDTTGTTTGADKPSKSGSTSWDSILFGWLDVRAVASAVPTNLGLPHRTRWIIDYFGSYAWLETHFCEPPRFALPHSATKKRRVIVSEPALNFSAGVVSHICKTGGTSIAIDLGDR